MILQLFSYLSFLVQNIFLHTLFFTYLFRHSEGE
jgi:hypothetical protein